MNALILISVMTGILGGLICLRDVHAQGHTMEKLEKAAANFDFRCMEFKAEGACTVGTKPGVRISYWEPSVLIETIGKPSNGWSSLANSSQHFHDVHIFDFPLKIVEQVVLCPEIPNGTLGIRYLSELDRARWHKESEMAGELVGKWDSLYPRRGFVGNWGPLYPRTGFVTHFDSAVSSALDAVRAVSAAGRSPSTHVVQSRLNFGINQGKDKMQMVYPKKTMCLRPGRDPRRWAKGKISKDGDYVWVYYKFKRCCKPVPVPAP